MIIVHGSKDCGNSPRNTFVQQIAVALETGRIAPEDFSESVIWESGSGQKVIGRQVMTEKLAARPTPATLTIEHAISHGKTGVACGQLTFANGETRRFCYVFIFTSVKARCVSMIKSYI